MHAHGKSTHARLRELSITIPTLAATTVLLSSLLLAFKAGAATTFRDVTDSIGSTPLVPEDFNGLRLAPYPKNLVGRDAVRPFLAAGGLNLALSVIIISLFVYVQRRSKPLLLSTWQRCGMFTVMGVSCALSLVMFIVSLYYHLGSSRFEPNYRSPAADHKSYGIDNVYDVGSFDLQAWTCQLSSADTFHGQLPVLFRQCVDETAALWLCLLVGISSTGIMVLVWFDCRGEKTLIRDRPQSSCGGTACDGLSCDFLECSYV